MVEKLYVNKHVEHYDSQHYDSKVNQIKSQKPQLGT